MHLLRARGDRHESSTRRAPGIVIGARKRSSRPQPAVVIRPAEEGVEEDVWKGREIEIRGPAERRATFQKGVQGKRSRQKTCQRDGAPIGAEVSGQRGTRRGVGPCRMAATRMTTTAR